MADPVWLDSSVIRDAADGNRAGHRAVMTELQRLVDAGHPLLIVKKVNQELFEGNPFKGPVYPIPPHEIKARKQVIGRFGITVDLSGSREDRLGDRDKPGYIDRGWHIAKKGGVTKFAPVAGESDSIVLSEVAASAKARKIPNPRIFTTDNAMRGHTAKWGLTRITVGGNPAPQAAQQVAAQAVQKAAAQAAQAAQAEQKPVAQVAKQAAAQAEQLAAENSINQVRSLAVGAAVFGALNSIAEWIQDKDAEKEVKNLEPEIRKLLSENPDKGVIIVLNYQQVIAPWFSLNKPPPMFLSATAFSGNSRDDLPPMIMAAPLPGYRLVQRFKEIPSISVPELNSGPTGKTEAIDVHPDNRPAQPIKAKQTLEQDRLGREARLGAIQRAAQQAAQRAAQQVQQDAMRATQQAVQHAQQAAMQASQQATMQQAIQQAGVTPVWALPH